MKIILRLFVSTLTVALVTLLLEFGRDYFAANSTLGAKVDQTIGLCFLLLLLASVWLYLRCWLGMFVDVMKELISLLRHKKTPQPLPGQQEDDDVTAEQPQPAPEKPRDRDPFDYEAADATEELAERQQTAAALFAGEGDTLSSEKEFFSLSEQTEAPRPAGEKPQTVGTSAQKKSARRKKAEPTRRQAEPSAEAAKTADETLHNLTDAAGNAIEPLQVAAEALNRAAELVAADEAEEQHISRAMAEVFSEDGEEDIFANRDGDVWVRSS